MSLGLHSLFSQKKGAVQGFVLLAAVAMLVVGILSVTAVHSKTIAFSPIFAAPSANQTYNFTITLGAGSATINEIRITKPGDFTAIYCLNANPVGSWSCATNGTTSLVSYVEFTGGELAAGGEVSINITSTSAAGAANYTFDVRTQGTGEAANTSKVNVTIDPHGPLVDLVNVSDGTNVLSGGGLGNENVSFLANSTKGIVFIINVTDNSSGMAQGAVNLYYNLTNFSYTTPLTIDYRNGSAGNISVFTASNMTLPASSTLYNVTLNISAMPTLNGTRVAFQIVANDSVHNVNVSNASVVTASYSYNFTIDAVAPQFVDVQIANQSLNASTSVAINTTKTWGSAVEYIINSSLILNVSALVRDDGGAGTINVEVMNRSGAFMGMNLLTGTNGSSTQTTWNFSAFNISDLVVGFAGDGLYNLTFRATDNVSNVNSTYNFTVDVDDSPPTASAATNISVNGVLSAGNVTLSTLINGTLINTSVNITLQTSSNINNQTRNVSVYGNNGNIFPMSFSRGTPSGASYWNLTLKYNDAMNSSALCALATTDGTQCNLRFNFTDVMGRENTSINLTIAVDGFAPNVSVLSPVFLTTNYTGTALINVSVNDTVGPIQNVSFRIISANALPGIDEGFYNDSRVNLTNGAGVLTTGANMTNWIPMSLGTGSNTQFLTNGTWNYTINLTALNFTDNSYIIQINVTDSAGRENSTVNRTGVIFDSSVPQNISIVAPATNSFWNANFTVNINATERVAGLLNVSVRLENGTHNFPWVGVDQVISALASSTNVGETVKFNASTFNITHIGGNATNATDGNFTLRLNVTDTAGNQNTSVTINFTIDTIVPAVAFVYPLNNRNQTGNFTINASVTESHINLVQFRWENGTITNGNSNNGTFANNPMTFNASENRANATFTNLTDGSAPIMFDSNYTIRLNVTDKAGNKNDTVYIQLVLDKSSPTVIADGPASNSIQTGDFLVNMTFNDNLTVAGTSAASLVNSTNINSSAYRLENNTFNSSWFSILQASTDFAAGNVDRNRTNATFTFADVANGRYDIRFWVNDTAGNQNSSVVVSNITLDNVVPSVAVSIVNVSPAVGGAVGASGTILFNATVSDNLPLNVSITNQTTIAAAGATYGVFYRFENASHTLNWTSMSTLSFFNTVHNNTGVEHKAVFNASNTTTTLADGDYKIRINATDRAGNQNTTVFMSITIQNAATNPEVNWSFLGGFIASSDLTNPVANSTPKILFNTSINATCKYSVDTQYQKYQHLPNTLSNNVSRSHNVVLGPLRDGSHTIYYSCMDVAGSSMPLSNNNTEDDTFNVDTRTLWNVTIPGKTDNHWPNYFQAAAAGGANGWSSFVLSTGALAATSLSTAQGGYNVTNVLASILKGTAEGNFTRIYAYTASTNSWETFIVGQGGNTFINFTNQTTYWINVSATERLEVN